MTNHSSARATHSLTGAGLSDAMLGSVHLAEAGEVTADAAFEEELTAFHEAGHAWAYHQVNLPLRYATVRPRERNTLGVCRPWKPRPIDIGVNAFVAACGPLAQAMRGWELRDDPWDEFEFDDLLTAAVLTGGHADNAIAIGSLDCDVCVEYCRGELERDWLEVERLARRLIAAGTVSGHEIWSIFGEPPVRRVRGGQRPRPRSLSND